MSSAWNAHNLAGEQAELGRLLKTHEKIAPKPATWLAPTVPEGVSVFVLRQHRRRRIRTSNPLERAVRQEIKRRTSILRVFMNEASASRLITAVHIETDEEYARTDRAFLVMDARHG